MPLAKPLIVVVVPVPDILPGLIVHAPLAGNPDKSTVPVPTEQLGCATIALSGVLGVVG